eukprot:1373636-Pleurochrysis_carterae.AAC.3
MISAGGLCTLGAGWLPEFMTFYLLYSLAEGPQTSFERSTALCVKAFCPALQYQLALSALAALQQ